MITASLILASLQRRRKNANSPSNALGKAEPTDVTQNEALDSQGTALPYVVHYQHGFGLSLCGVEFQVGLCSIMLLGCMPPPPTSSPTRLLPHGEGCLQHPPCLSVGKSQMHSCVRNPGSQENTGHHSSGFQTWPPTGIMKIIEKPPS